MEKFIYIGKLIGTHGIRGELKLKSEYQFIDTPLKVGNHIYITPNYQKYTIQNIRYHKNVYLLLLEEFSNINEVLHFVGNKVYIDSSEGHGIRDFKEELLGLTVFCESKLLGKVTNFFNSGNHNEVIEIDDKKLIPFHKDLIKSINYQDGKIEIIYIKGLINED